MGELVERLAAQAEKIKGTMACKWSEPLFLPFGYRRAPRGRRLGPTLSYARIQAFETVHEIRLPQAYRIFLTAVGDGGVGPAYGLCELSTWRSVELPGKLAEVELDGIVARGLRVAEAGGIEGVVLLVTGPHSDRLVEVGMTPAGKSVRLRPEKDFLSWYAAWLETVDLTVSKPRPEADLVGLLSTAEEAERARAIYELGALEAISDDTVRLIESLALHDPGSRTRYRAVDLLGELGCGSVGVLVRAVQDGERSISRRALVHVMRLAGAGPAWQEARDVMRSTGDRVGVLIAEDLEERRLRGVLLP